jgi:two-component system sensor histidine kinase DesK
MTWMERFGKYLALACLFLLWPALDAYLRGAVTGLRGAFLAAAVGLSALIYVWYCLAGHALRNSLVPVASVAALTLLSIGVGHLSSQPANNNFLIALLLAGFALPTRRALIAFGALAAVMLVEGIVLSAGLSAQVILQLVLTLPTIILFGGAAMGLRYLVSSLTELRAARAQIAQHATDRERARIARDLHDLLGHSLSLITLKGELATRLLPEGGAATNEVRDMLALSRQAMQEVRQAVSGYRQPTLATELRAARVAHKAAGIELDVLQEVGALDRQREAVLGWVIREACTNVIRHSGASHCRIALTDQEGRLEIEVVNDGWHVPQLPVGNGLRGLQERLAALGGTLEATAMPDSGFRLIARLPAEGHSQEDRMEVGVIR